MRLPSDATGEHALTVGPVEEDDEHGPIGLILYNAASDSRDVACRLDAGGDPVFDRTWTLPSGGYTSVELYAPAEYVANVGHPGDTTAIPIPRDRFDGYAETVTAKIAANGTIDIGIISQTSLGRGIR